MKVGVVGCGSIGARYARWLAGLGAEVVAQDLVPERLMPLADVPGVSVCNTVEELLGRKVERVLVATPPNAHASVACTALDAGADVLLEKPIAATLEDGQRIVETADRAGRRAWVVCNMRFHDGPRTLKQHLPRIGRPLFARAHFGHRLSQMRPAGTNVFASRTEEGGGVILDCIHEIDYLQWLFGEVEAVDGWLAQLGPDRIDAEDYAEIRLVFKSGVRAALHLDFLMRRKRRGAELVGTNGNLIWNSEGRAPEVCTVAFGDQNGEDVVLQAPEVDAGAAYGRMLLAFLAQGEGLQTAAEGCRALSVALQARGNST
jgi:predicted dehydrogenase